MSENFIDCYINLSYKPDQDLVKTLISMKQFAERLEIIKLEFSRIKEPNEIDYKLASENEFYKNLSYNEIEKASVFLDTNVIFRNLKKLNTASKNFSYGILGVVMNELNRLIQIEGKDRLQLMDFMKDHFLTFGKRSSNLGDRCIIEELKEIDKTHWKEKRFFVTNDTDLRKEMNSETELNYFIIISFEDFNKAVSNLNNVVLYNNQFDLRFGKENLDYSLLENCFLNRSVKIDSSFFCNEKASRKSGST